jgi:plastocyanin
MIISSQTELHTSGKSMKRLVLPAAFAALMAVTAWFPAPAHAAEPLVFEITIKDHKFDPAELELPAGKEIKLVVRNLDPTPEEFESAELNREKIIAGGGKGIFYLDPLKPGTYPFFGEFNQATAQGKIVVK